MVKEFHVAGFDSLVEKLDTLKGEHVFIFFTGSPGEDGKSWCPQCVDADPVVEKAKAALPDNVVFIRCDVGDRTFWKDQNNVFRTDDRFKLTRVPTLMNYSTKNKIIEEQVANPGLVQMLFEGDE